jgi:hypothetical protein
MVLHLISLLPFVEYTVYTCSDNRLFFIQDITKEPWGEGEKGEGITING